MRTSIIDQRWAYGKTRNVITATSRCNKRFSWRINTIYSSYDKGPINTKFSIITVTIRTSLLDKCWNNERISRGVMPFGANWYRFSCGYVTYFVLTNKHNNQLFVCFFNHMLLTGSPLGAQQSRWFPVPPGQVDNNPSVDYKPKNADLYDSKHGIKMGVASPECDDAKVAYHLFHCLFYCILSD